MPDYLEIRGPGGLTVRPLSDASFVIGRDPAGQVVLDGDTLASRRHAVFQPLPAGWCISDLGSRNGTRVNGELVVGSRALHDGDEITVGTSRLVLRTTPSAPQGDTTRTAEPPPVLTRREQDVLVALLRPARADTGTAFSDPASTREIAQALVVSEAAVKQHLAHLYEKFGIGAGERRRVRLANEALRRGAVRLSELRARS